MIQRKSELEHIPYGNKGEILNNISGTLSTQVLNVLYVLVYDTRAERDGCMTGREGGGSELRNNTTK